MIDRDPQWVGVELALAIHSRQLAEHGGSEGVRDNAGLESALARPRQLLAYGACRALAVEAKIRLCEDRFSTVRRPIAPLWAKNRRKYGPHRRICSPAGQSPTGSYGGPEVDLPALAATYAFGIACNHPFIDGNKRTAYVVCRTFLLLNGWDLSGPLQERYPVFLSLAAGELSEDDLAAWLRARARPGQVNEPRPAYAASVPRRRQRL